MKKFVCIFCNQYAEYKKIIAKNMFALICKDCAISNLAAKAISLKDVYCRECEISASYAILNQVNRITNFCEPCLLEYFKKI